jgi:hypothetical protein
MWLIIQCGLDVMFQVKEIYNYTQDDLITEDVLLLDCQREIYIWVGLHSVVKSKQEALNLGLVSCLLSTFIDLINRLCLDEQLN